MFVFSRSGEVATLCNMMMNNNSINDKIVASYVEIERKFNNGNKPQATACSVIAEIKCQKTFFRSCSCLLCRFKEEKKIYEKTLKQKKNFLINKNFLNPEIGLFSMAHAKNISRHVGGITAKDLYKQVCVAMLLMIECLEEDLYQSYTVFEEDVIAGTSISPYLSELRSVLRGSFSAYRVYCYNHVIATNRCLLLAHKILNQEHFDREDLVGIEHNPGPDMLIKFLKNLEREEMLPRASAQKRGYNKSKILENKQKKIIKQKQQKIYNARDLKYRPEQQDVLFDILIDFIDHFGVKYAPEGIFTVGLDNQSTERLEEMVSKLGGYLSNITLTHDFGIKSLCDKLMQFFLGIHEATKSFWNVFVGVFKVVVSFLDKAKASLILSFFGETFVDAVSFIPEEGLPWSGLYALWYANHFKEAISEWDWLKFTNIVHEIRKGATSSKNSLEILKLLFKEVSDLVCSIAGIENPLFKEEDIDILRIQEESKKLHKEFRDGLINEYNFSERVWLLQADIEDLLYEKRKTVDHSVKEKLQYMLKKIDPLTKYVARFANPNNGPRIEPIAILLAGPTGVGKTTITVPFLLALLGNILPDDKKAEFMKNHNDFIFFRANENEFWDGYKMRNVAIVYDDFGQQKDVVGNPSADAFEIIRLKNTAPYHLHFAALEDKQRNYAVPKLIYATTNLQRLRFESLTNSEAVARRFELSYVQVPKLQYCRGNPTDVWSRRLDLDKIREEFPYVPTDCTTYAALDVIEFIPWDFIQGKQKEGPALTFNQLLKKAIELHEHNTTKGDVMLKFHQHMKTFRPEMFEDVFDKTVYLQKLNDACEGMYSYCGIKYVSAREYFNKLCQADKDAWTKFAQVGLLSATFFYSFKAVANFFSVDTDAEGYSGNSSTGTKVMKPSLIKEKLSSKKGEKRKQTPKRSNHATDRLKIKNFISEASDPSFDPYMSLLKRNLYRIRHGGNMLGWALFIKGRTFVVPRHFDYSIMASIDENYKVEFINPIAGTVSISFDWSDESMTMYDEHEEKKDPYDYIYFTLPKFACRQHANISDMFATSNRFKKDDYFSSQLVCVRGESIVFQTPEVSIKGEEIYQWREMGIRSRDLMYSCSTAPGDCGSPLVSIDPRLMRPTILGIHVAGTVGGWSSKKTCLGVSLFKEEVLNAISFDDSVIEVENFRIESCDVVEGFNTLTNDKQPRVPVQTKLEPSELQGKLWEVTTAPAMLRRFTNSDGEHKDPWAIARSNYSHNEVSISFESLEQIFPIVCNLVLKDRNSKPWEPRVLTFDEAVSGVAGVDFVEGINRSTSPGYPYVLDNKKKGKQAWFGSEGEYDLHSEAAIALRRKVTAFIEDAKSGIRNRHVFIDYLKDERRPIAKVQAGKTRQFMSCGMDLLVLYKMYFGDFIRSICANRVINGIAVGINPFEEWDTLAAYLHYDSTTVFTAGDYSKFDAKIPVPIGYQVLRCIEMFYSSATDEEIRIRRVLFEEIINSQHISGGLVYEFVGGNPSGQPMTAVFNSIANLFMLAYAGFINWVESDITDSFKTVFNTTRFTTFGDDNVIGYLPKYENVFGQQVLERTIPIHLGMDYTNESKDGTIKNARSLTEVTFLKRSFRFEGIKWYCPLDLSVIKETLNWKRKDLSRNDMFLRIECVLAELAQHGKSVFEQMSPKIVKAAFDTYNYVPANAVFLNALRSEHALNE